jgi:TM2 domain-containing membrane protein YozV
MTNSFLISTSSKSSPIACLLCVFFGYLGLHRFYVGKIGTGVIQLLTFGGFGIWYLIDILMLSAGEFEDSNGYKLAGSTRKLVALILCYFLGIFGVHRFYTGKIGSGVLMLLTFGGLGVWWLIDMLMICCDQFKDKNGLLLIDADSNQF